MTKAKIAAGYVRCSTDEQGATSIPQQKDAIAKFATDNHLTIAEWFVDEGRSGTQFESRPGFMELKRRVESGSGFSHVICYDESRWGRAIDPEENTYFQVWFRKHGVDVVLVRTSVDKSNEFAPVMSSLERVQSSQYSKKLSELTLRGCIANGMYSNGGTAPYGYKRVAVNVATGARRELSEYYDEADKKMKGDRCIRRQEKVVWDLGDPAEVAVVKRIFDMKAKGYGYVPIADGLNSDAIPCPKRGRWKASDQKWSGVTIKSIINNPAYYGARAYNRNSMSKIVATRKGLTLNRDVRYAHFKNSQSEWLVTENAHPSIISKELWDKANVVVNPRFNITRRLNSEYLLTGLLKCPHCGFNFQGQSHHKEKIFYYVDGGYQNKGKSVCSYYSLRKENIESAIIEVVQDQLCSSRVADLVEKRMEEYLSERPMGLGDRLTEIERAFEANEKAIANLIKALESGADFQSLRSRLTALENEKEALLSEQARLRSAAPLKLDKKEISKQASKFVLDFKDNFQKASFAQKKLALRQVLCGVVIAREPQLARCYIKTIPGVRLPIYEHVDVLKLDAIKRKRAPVGTDALSCYASSGGRT